MEEIKKGIVKISESPYTVPALLICFFVLSMVMYINTTVFEEISEAGALIRTYNKLLEGESLMPIKGFYWYLTPAFVAKFIFSLFGTLHAYFIFQCLLATTTVYLVYKIVYMISKSRISGIISILLSLIYMEFVLISSVFYNQIYEIFFSTLFLFFVIKLYDAKKTTKVIVYSLSIILAVLLSLFFRNTLLVTSGYLLLLAGLIAYKKKYSIALRFVLLSIALFAIIFVVKPINMFRESMPSEREFGVKSVVRLSFWGHTMYGGHGGEATFVYEENEELFNNRLQAYAQANDLDPEERSVKSRFMRYEVNRFVTQEPHKWLFLQGKKFFYTFGIVPIRDGLQMLSTGRLRMHWLMSALILQAPYLFIVLLFLLTVDINLKKYLNEPHKQIIYLFGLYLVTGICFYATYQERYRLVVVLLLFIPVISLNIHNMKHIFVSKVSIIIRVMLLMLFISVWTYQGYEALVLHRDRYFSALNKFE